MEMIWIILLYGSPIIGGVITLIMILFEIVEDQRWLHECPARDKCNCGNWCVRHSVYGCPAGGEFLSVEERKELQKKINALDEDD